VQLLEAFEKNGMGAKEFCQAHNIGHLFYKSGKAGMAKEMG
jgi:hypothetical protein